MDKLFGGGSVTIPATSHPARGKFQRVKRRVPARHFSNFAFLRKVVKMI